MSELDAIVAAHSDAVWRTAYRLLSDYDDALDCYQETFLAALRLSPQGEVRHWRTLLLRIATRRAIDQLRERYRSDKLTAQLQTRPLGATPAGPQERVQTQELQDHVRQALTRLPAPQAEAFWLRHLEQLSVDEVAQAMNIEPGHVRVLVHRGALALRSLLEASYGSARNPEKSS